MLLPYVFTRGHIGPSGIIWGDVSGHALSRVPLVSGAGEEAVTRTRWPLPRPHWGLPHRVCFMCLFTWKRTPCPASTRRKPCPGHRAISAVCVHASSPPSTHPPTPCLTVDTRLVCHTLCTFWVNPSSTNVLYKIARFMFFSLLICMLVRGKGISQGF